MTKQLYLLRHAEAGEKSPGRSDATRELTANGIRQAKRMSAWLREEDFSAGAIFCSPATRARQTLMVITEQWKFGSPDIFYDEALYEASVKSLLGIIHGLEQKYENVMLVGHNPGLSDLTAYLTGSSVSLTTAGIAIIQFPADTWRGKGKLIRYADPSSAEENVTQR